MGNVEVVLADPGVMAIELMGELWGIPMLNDLARGGYAGDG